MNSIGLHGAKSCGFMNISSILEDWLANWETGRQSLIGWGIAELDRHIGAMAPGQLIVIGSRPGGGKTGLALSVARHAAIRQRRAVGVVELEGDYQEIATRLLAPEAGVPLDTIKGGSYNQGQHVALLKASATLRSARLISFDALARSLDVKRVKDIAERERRKAQLDLLIVDYVQLLRNFDHPYDTREEEFSSVVRSLKHLARNLEIPIIAVSQMSPRGHLPTRIDELEGAAPLEEHADLVLLLHRPISRALQGGSVAQLHVAKNRLGGEQNLCVEFVEETASFREIAA